MILKSTASAGLSLLLSALPLSLIAQERPSTPPSAPGEAPADKPRESWAAEARPVSVSRTPGQVVIFDEEDLQRSGARTLGAFLIRELPAQVQNQGGPGLPSHIYLGGSRPQDTLLLVDGVPLMDPGRLGQDLNEIPLLGITRIEVITGAPGSGTGGTGGTIALFTGKPLRAGLSGDLSGLGGNNAQGQSTATPGFTWAGGYLRGGNLSAQEKPATATERPYRQVSNFLGLGQTWGAAAWSLAWRGTAFGVPQPFQEVTDASRVYNPARESRQRSDAGQLRLDWDLGAALNLETTLGFSRFRHEQAQAGTALPSQFEGRETRFLWALHVVTGTRSGLTIRIEGQAAQQDGDVDPAVLGAAKGNQIGLGLEWRFEPRPGLRLVGLLRGTKERQYLAQGGTDVAALDDSGHTLRLGVNQELGGGLRIYAAAAGGRSAPALIQQLRNGQVAGATPLRMEQTTTLQVGLGWGKGNWYGKVESQQQSGRDLIGDTGSAFVNQERVQVRGTEAAFGWRTAKQRGVEAFVRAQEARDLNAPEGQQYRTGATQRRPFSAHGLKGFLGWSRVQTEVHYTLQGRQYSSVGEGTGRLASNGLPPIIRPTQVVYREVGLSTAVQAGRHWTYTLRGEHLLQPRTTAAEWVANRRQGQDDASIIDGYPAASPSYSLEARYRF